MKAAIEIIESTTDFSPEMIAHHRRHGIKSMNKLTVQNEEQAEQIVSEFKQEITGKSVVEIGAGVGYLALEMAKHAKSVIAIEADPAWSWCFTKFLYNTKPSNLTWIFGAAGNPSTDFLSADVAVIRGMSGLREMVGIGERIAPRIVLSLDGYCVAGFSGTEEIDTVLDFMEAREKLIIDMMCELSGMKKEEIVI